MDIEKLLSTLDMYLSTDGCNLDNETVQPVEGIYEEIEPSEIYDIAVKELPAEDIDHHASDLYLRKTEKSTKLINDLKNKDCGLLTTFVDNIEGDIWYELPFCYPERNVVKEDMDAEIEKAEYKEIDIKEPEVEAAPKELNEEVLEEEMDLLSKDATFRYMMLDRMRTDCAYFLGNGNRNVKHLWAGSVERQIQLMKDLYNSFEEKPEWISMEDIENYEKQMKEVHESVAAGLLRKLTEGAGAAVTIYFDHDPRNDYRIHADIDTVIGENKITCKNILIADYYYGAHAEDGGYIEFEENAMKEAFVKDYNEYDRMEDDPEITVDDIEEVYLGGYEDIQPLVYGGGWIKVNCPDGTVMTWEKETYLPRIEICAIIEGEEHRLTCDCDGIYHPSNEACMIISDVEAAERAQHPEAFDDMDESVKEYPKQGLNEDLISNELKAKVEEYEKENNLPANWEIAQFDTESKEFQLLREVAEKVSENSPIKTRVEDTYFDYGQKWLWTTLIAIHEKADDTSYWQAIYPSQQKAILAGYGEEIAKDLIDKYNKEYAVNETMNEISLDLAQDVADRRETNNLMLNTLADKEDRENPELNKLADEAKEKHLRNRKLFKRWKEAKNIQESLNEKKEEIDIVAKYEDGDKLHQIIRKDEKYHVQFDVNGKMKQRAGVKNLPTAITTLLKKCPEAKEVK